MEIMTKAYNHFFYIKINTINWLFAVIKIVLSKKNVAFSHPKILFF